MSYTDQQIKQITDKVMRGEEPLSFSSFSQFCKSPAHFIRYKMRDKVVTPAMLEGRLVHLLCFQPQKFDEQYFLLDDTDIVADIGGKSPRSTKAYKEWKELTTRDAKDREIIPLDQYFKAEFLVDAVKDNAAARIILSRCKEFEQRIEWQLMDMPFVGYVDARGPKTIVDLKLCPDASPDKFSRDIIYKKLYLQAAMYMIGGMERRALFSEERKIKSFYNIAVDREGGVSVHKYDERLLEYGSNMLMDKMHEFQRCLMSNDWRAGYEFYSERGDGSFIAELPGWMY